ncbi:hypothetical protein GCM10009804_55050 [Kribbella hippodromi]|uniref:Uncharacterized protein n=1 Tax=Kribbella hippodromi TaxID=434347 RepID=A0ABN2E2Z4_9ACTN
MSSRLIKAGAAGLTATLAVVGLSVVQAPTASAATSCKSGYNWRACSTIDKRIPVSFTAGYRDSVRNLRNYPITASCQASVSKTVTWGVSVGVKAEVKAAIFASVEASVTANVQTSMATGYVTSANFTVKAKDTVYCDRGIYQENVRGHSTLSYYGGGAGTIRQSWTAHAPSRAQWLIY